MQSVAIETTWIETTDAGMRDVVLMARVDGYVRRLEMGATMDAMRKHMSECRARYVIAWDMDLWLSQQTAFGMKWGIR
jgi:hypothetical protein